MTVALDEKPDVMPGIEFPAIPRIPPDRGRCRSRRPENDHG